MPTSRPRSLADDLRARTDAALVTLLRARPDLLSPVPSDLASLAARAATRPSVSRALDQLDRFGLQVVEVLCALPDHSTEADVRRLLGADPTAVLDLLHERALVYRDDEGGYVVPRTVAEVVGHPAGLGPAAEQALHTYGPARLAQIATDLGLPAAGDPVATARTIAAVLGDDDRLAALLAQAPAGAADALATMVWGPPTGHLERARRDVDAGSAGSPVEWLLAHALLVGTDTATVVLPREVALHLRGGRVHRGRRAGAARPRHLAGRHRATSTGRPRAPPPTRCGWSRSCCELWSDDPPKVLRTGGVGVRERCRAAADLDVDETRLALLVETAHAAGLLAAGDDGRDTASCGCRRRRTTAGWTPRSAERWLVLAQAWLTSTRVPGLVGGRDQRDRTLSAARPRPRPHGRARRPYGGAGRPRRTAHRRAPPRPSRSRPGCAGRPRGAAAGCRTSW